VNASFAAEAYISTMWRRGLVVFYLMCRQRAIVRVYCTPVGFVSESTYR